MKSKIVIFLFIFLVTGCAFHSEPKDNLEFHQISQLSELAGVYKNKGNPSSYLSWIIWPDIGEITPASKEVISSNIKHEDIELIEVIPKDNSLIVKAISKNCSIFEKIYILDQDFKIKDGKIIIRKEAHLLSRGGDDVLLGPSYEDITLGLDSSKHAKSRSLGYAAGLVLMIFPMAVSDTSDIRYDRVSNKPQNYKNCNNR
jgi:hypothetical protein